MNKIDVAVIGLGAMGGTHVGAAKKSPYVNKIYGYEPEPARLELRAKELGVIAADINEIMKNPDIKLIYIASVNEVHSEHTVMALKAGKAVLCEKPMGISLAEANKMIEAERKTGNFLQIGFELHYSKLYQKVKSWIDEGLIGTPVNCHCRYYCSEGHLKNSWRSRSKGTLIGEKLSHYLDLQRWWFGDGIESVYSYHAPSVVKYFNHPDNHQINIKFKKGGVANLNFVMYVGETVYGDHTLLEKQSDDGHYLQYYIFGEKGAIETDVFRRRIRRWEFSDSPERMISKIIEEIKFSKDEDQIWFHNTQGQNLRIAELVAKGMRPEVSATDAFESMKICFAAVLSERENRVINFSEL